MRPLRLLAPLAVVSLLLSGCALQLLGAPQGDFTLTATFDDVVDLMQGHTVQTSNVVIGSVTHVQIENYRAKVTMSITDGHPIPVGTKAVVRRTSLLGEHFVDLVFPDDLDPNSVQYLGSGADITDTDADPEVEELAARAGELVNALASGDIATIVQVGAEALGGRGPQLNRVIGQLSQYLGGLDSQLGAIGSAIDNASQLASTLAPLRDQFGALLDEAGVTTETLTSTRDQFFTALRQFNDVAATTGDVVLSHADSYTELLHEADTFVAPLAARADDLGALLTNISNLVPKIPRAVSDGQLLAAAWVDMNFDVQGAADYFQRLPEFFASLPDYLQRLLEGLGGQP